MKSRRLRARRARDPAELNITAFLNLMVVLVPFLLITAVFSRIAVLELNLPAGEGGEPDEPPPLALEVVVREHVIEVADRHRGLLTRITAGDHGHDLQALAEYLVEVKQQHPQTDDVTLLLEPDVLYDTLVQVMDTVRVQPVSGADALARADLFPVISIGDAPRDGV
jgi:biopolymer transport protein ExbD